MKKKVLIAIFIILLFNIVTVYAGDALYGYFKDFERVKVIVDGKEVKSEIPAFIVDNTTVLPLRAVAESLNSIVNWDDEKRTIKLVKPNVNMQFTANPVYDKDEETYVVYSPFGKIPKNKRSYFSFYVYSEIDNLPKEKLEVKVILRDPDNQIVQEGYVRVFDATIENSLQYINYFEEVDFVKTGNYHVDLLVKGKSTQDVFSKIGQKYILVY